MSWATVAETLSYTGITVSTDNITAAQFMVELFADVTEEADANISTKNARLLKMAVAYQAAWLTEHPDVFTNIDITNMAEDGIAFSNAHANSGLLAPMAKRAISRLSWYRNSNIRIRPARRNQGSNIPHRFFNMGLDSTPAQDDQAYWEPL